ncbi:hypothetical protein BLBBOR_163 [Blattabacterium sp. (Blatta orientalis) str. Tarazona]|nr:hypothetical protein BLBBOR_163 [Blattabacterium sp. (Blatta orientalis) str. Tarazona]
MFFSFSSEVTLSFSLLLLDVESSFFEFELEVSSSLDVEGGVVGVEFVVFSFVLAVFSSSVVVGFPFSFLDLLLQLLVNKNIAKKIVVTVILNFFIIINSISVITYSGQIYIKIWNEKIYHYLNFF